MPHTAQILIHQISFTLPNGTALFDGLSLAFSAHKSGLVGRNGIGKSTLLRLILGALTPSTGTVQVKGTLAYVPQNPVVLPGTCLAGFWGIESRIRALQRISNGSVAAHDFDALEEDWSVETRLSESLRPFGLHHIPWHRPLKDLSGGELTRLHLAKAFSSAHDFLLLDEPTNHLDQAARQQLYEAIRQWPGSMIVVSHDRSLLNLMDEIIELNTLGADRYGGNFEDYQRQKAAEVHARHQVVQDAKKSLKKVKVSIQASREKHSARQAKGQALRRTGSQSKITLNAMQDRSARSLGEMSTRHQRMLEAAEANLQSAKEQTETLDEIRVTLPKTQVPQGKRMIRMEQVNFSYPNASAPLIQNFNLSLKGPRRMALTGCNGSGKTTLVKLMLGVLQPQSGTVHLGTDRIQYLDQSLTQLTPEASVLDNFLRLNPDSTPLSAHRALAAFLFKNTAASKTVQHLSGGEKLRVLLACVLMSATPPQLLILDEPTNHLDLESVRSIESALNAYQGAVVVISHDPVFLKKIGIERELRAPYQSG